MAKYFDFWQKLLRDFNSELNPERLLEKTYHDSGIDKIGDRKSYSGYLEVFGCDVRNHTNSQVFRDLAEVVKKNGHIKTKLSGLLRVTVDKYHLVTFNYEPFSWELMMNRYRDYQDRTQMAEELYKWELVQKFQTHWSDYESGSIGFQAFVQGIDWGNLIYHMFGPNFEEVVRERSQEVEKALLELYNLEKPLQGRIESFKNKLEELHQEVKGKPEDKLFLAEREVATLLTYRYPDHYTFFVPSFYVPLAKALGRKNPKKWYQLSDYYQIVNEFLKDVLPKYEDAVAVKNQLTQSEKYYRDDQHLLLVQDIFYVTLMKNQLPSSKEWPLESDLSDYQYVVSLLPDSDFWFFIDLLKECVRDFAIRQDQVNIAFTVRQDKRRLGFIVNNRLVLAIQERDGVAQFLAIDSQKYGSKSDAFKNQRKETEAYLNFGLDLKTVNKHIPSIFEAIKLELDRNYTSPQNQKSNKEFIMEVYQDLKYPISPPTNKILYGPPGTGKTYKLKNEYFQKYTDRETSISTDQHFEQVAKDLSWWQAVALALLETGAAKVAEIKRNRWVQQKSTLSESKNTNATLWGTLQYHTIEESESVSYKRRLPPLIFDKLADSRWEILKDEVEQQAPELFEIKQSVDNFKPNPDKLIKRYVFTTFHQSFAYEDFIEGIKPVLEDETTGELAYQIESGIFKRLCDRAATDPHNRYAIFIDEINRGNIANIFGELITLIEKDKRKGCENEIRVELPYSKKPFSVPANVDIYGTMNTADRSVEALDTALRRRFVFEEMPPKPESLRSSLVLARFWIRHEGDYGPGEASYKAFESDISQFLGMQIDDYDSYRQLGSDWYSENAPTPEELSVELDKLVQFKGIDLSALLKTINRRIEVLIDRDHCIGHSYLLNVFNLSDLKSAFYNNIIPLLQEYFYNDYVKIGMVLGSGFIEVKPSTDNRFAEIEDSLALEYEERKLYGIVPAQDLDLKSAIAKLMNVASDA